MWKGKIFHDTVSGNNESVPNAGQGHYYEDSTHGGVRGLLGAIRARSSLLDYVAGFIFQIPMITTIYSLQLKSPLYRKLR